MSNQILSDRYGQKSARKPLPTRFWAILSAVLIAGAVVWGIWVQTAQSAAAPEFKNTGYELTSGDEVSVSFEIVKDPSTTAVCTLQALNTASAPVGWDEVTIGPSENGERVTAHTAHLFITSPAHTAVVEACWSL
ncbi:DUF4307 domain-containing protein [Rothia sp. ZJ932]|uniref:DUF4307 domain-containing protein n=1 Tax=Rothia sp. ZJ932 TaxID=2810516 RepID=UPI001967775A|nr:DUF4307 domain-containing protein [Rothia sp. ZJ932]QRZ61236.1 DUF4307 domain-containing protein [Rothia sp. ZJ932]